MRKVERLFICILVGILLAGCNGIKGTQNVKEGEAVVKKEGDTGTVEKAEPQVEDREDRKKIDVDLTALSATMVYSEVYNMLMSPQDYMGKLVKMEGICGRYHDEEKNKDFYACIILDATACCSQGIEYELAKGQKYPKEGENICVTGRFDTYQEGKNTYCTLRDARLEE